MIDLSPFCAGEESFFTFMCKPFNLEGFTFATNGYIVVRVPLRPKCEPIKSKNHMDGVLRLFRDVGEIGFQSIPRICWPDAAPAPACGTCAGTGKIIDDGEPEECPSCEGDGRKPWFLTAFWRGKPMQTKYLDMIAALPGAALEDAPGADGPVRFRFHGGYGAVMSMRTPGDVSFGELEALIKQTNGA